MLKNKSILIIFLFVHCSYILSGEKPEMPFSIEELRNVPAPGDENLTRQPGHWTTKKQLMQEGLWNKEENFFTNKKLTNNSFFEEPINSMEQREDWYVKTSYIAEFYSTVSNIPFFAVAGKAFIEKKPVAALAILAAGTGSAVSHAIPRLWTHRIDTLTALSAIAGVAYDCNLYNLTVLIQTMQNPINLLLALMTGGAYVADVALARLPRFKLYRKKLQTPLHVFWHCAAVMFLYSLMFYSAQK